MELLAVIHHPSAPVRPAAEIVRELAAAYDRVYGGAAKQRTWQRPHATVVQLQWGELPFDWPAWREADGDVLATVGYPTLHADPATDDSEMVSPQRLTDWLGGDGEVSRQLGYVGGYFAAAHLRSDGRVRLTTNYLGEVPLYRAEHDGVTVWSNKAAAAALLAGLKPELNVEAARQFILLSHTLDECTLFRGVSLTPPATGIELDAQTWRSSPYLKLPDDYFAHRQPTADITRGFVKQLGPLIEAMKQQPVRLHLSGGLDSRAVAACCVHHGLKIPALTFHCPNDETPAARRLTKHLGLPYHMEPAAVADDATFRGRIEPSMWQSDGLMSLKYLAGRTYDQEFVRDGGYSPVEGLGGEYGRAYYFAYAKFFDRVEQGDLSNVLRKAIGGGDTCWPSSDDFAPIRQRITAYLDEARDAGLDHFRATTWYYVNQKMRHWATARRNIGWRWVIDPLQMPGWTYRGMSAAPDEQTDERLIRAVIEHAMPGTNNVPTVPDLVSAARRRRVASNRLVRGAYRAWDAIKPKPRPSLFEQALRAQRAAFVRLVDDAGEALRPIITPQQADALLASQPWTYIQTELFWHVATVASFVKTFVQASPAIRSCRDESSPPTSATATSADAAASAH